MLRTWKTGPRAGQPKLGPAAQSLLDRGFVSLNSHGRLPRLFFTAAGLAALRAMMRDRRLADPEKFAHIRVELGIDPPAEAKAAE
jgi:2-hydroxychromene-2-carboxylate isomerase